MPKRTFCTSLCQVAAIAFTLAVSGCMYVKQSARGPFAGAEGNSLAASTGFVVPESAWPDLVPDGMPTFVEESSQVFKSKVALPGQDESPIELRVNTTRHAGAMGSAWVQWYKMRIGEGADSTPDRPTSFEVFFWNPSDTPPEGMINGCIAGLFDDPGLAQRRAWINATKSLRIKYDIILPKTRPIRGLVLYAASLGPEYERPVVNEFIRRGWAVVTTGSASISVDRLASEVIDAQDRGDEAFRDYARLAAEECDKVLAGYAYGWEAACEMVERYYPEIPTRPRVMAGFSFGAIMTPPGAARLADKVDAAILVGGGTNLLGILAETPVLRFPIRVRDVKTGAIRPATPAEIERVGELYMEYSKLDGHHTARSLARKPVLMLHAELDGWVPARFGRDLWEQAGRPERWRGPFGHMLMFYFLGHQARPIADWLDRATEDIRPQGGGT